MTANRFESTTGVISQPYNIRAV